MTCMTDKILLSTTKTKIMTRGILNNMTMTKVMEVWKSQGSITMVINRKVMTKEVLLRTTIITANILDYD